MTTDALIIRENNNIGEADRFITALTRDCGVVRASARGARNLKSRSASATQLLSYSRLTLHRGRDKYIIEDAQPITVFFDLRSDLDKLSLSQYFCELAGVLAPQEEPAGDFLRLMLNALHFLGSGRRDPRLIKGVVELRMLGLAGFMPDLLACSSCGSYGTPTDGMPSKDTPMEGGKAAAEETEPMWLLPREGTLLCRSCSAKRPLSPGGLPLTPSVLAAMRHVVYAEFEKCFSFAMAEDGLKLFARTAEAYLLSQLNRSFKTLEFYHSMAQ